MDRALFSFVVLTTACAAPFPDPVSSDEPGCDPAAAAAEAESEPFVDSLPVAEDTGTAPESTDPDPADDAVAEDETEAGDTAPADPWSDTIYGVEVERADAFWVEGDRIYDGDEVIALRGISWFGFDTIDHALHGLWTGQTTADVLDRVETLGFNALRIPVSPEALRSDTSLPAWPGVEDMTTSRELLEHLLEEAAHRDLYVLLDHHTCSSSAGHLAESPLSCSGYDEAAWLADLEDLAQLSVDYNNVVGIDLFNEPYGLSWSEWRAMAEDASARVLTINPRTLVFVQGVGEGSSYGSANPFWGENLYEAVTDAPDIPTARLVYSPHTYGPSVYEQDYFSDGRFPANMPAIWDEHFGHLAASHPVVPGEFGGRNTGRDAIWQEAFVDYMIASDMQSFFYWSLNPNSGDTGGILLDDWISIDEGKMQTLAPLMALSGG